MNNQLQKIAIASDHAGFNLKSVIIKEFSSKYKIIDCGCNDAQISVDYPDFTKKAVEKIINKEADLGILICGSGIGVSIAANRFKEIRAAICNNFDSASLSRKHNNANVICLGSRFIENKCAIDLVKTFLTTDFEGGRHSKRVHKLNMDY
jgi:ribose 5-phosphate isomerase B